MQKIADMIYRYFAEQNIPSDGLTVILNWKDRSPASNGQKASASISDGETQNKSTDT